MCDQGETLGEKMEMTLELLSDLAVYENVDIVIPIICNEDKCNKKTYD